MNSIGSEEPSSKKLQNNKYYIKELQERLHAGNTKLEWKQKEQPDKLEINNYRSSSVWANKNKSEEHKLLPCQEKQIYKGKKN